MILHHPSSSICHTADFVVCCCCCRFGLPWKPAWRVICRLTCVVWVYACLHSVIWVTWWATHGRLSITSRCDTKTFKEPDVYVHAHVLLPGFLLCAFRSSEQTHGYSSSQKKMVSSASVPKLHMPKATICIVLLTCLFYFRNHRLAFILWYCFIISNTVRPIFIYVTNKKAGIKFRHGNNHVINNNACNVLKKRFNGATYIK